MFIIDRELLDWITATIESIPVISIILTCALIYVVRWFLTPLNVIKDYSDVGYDHLMQETRHKKGGRQTRIEVAEDCRKKRIVGSLPPVFPNGWFAVADSDEIARKEVKHIRVLGEHLAIFRSDSGKVRIVSAICPHLGANLAVGGTVEGECIRCPFHGWKFSGIDGKCDEIPYSKSIPEGGEIKVWSSCEVNSFIWFWYHAENEPPSWQLPIYPNVNDGKWWYRGRNEYYVNAHIQEIPENGADITHLPILHGAIVFAGSNLYRMKNWWMSFMTHKWTANWAASQEKSCNHVGCMTLVSDILFFGRYKAFHMDVKAHQIGPAFVAMFIKTIFGPFLILQTVTPVEPLLQKVVHKVFYPFRMSLYGTMTFYTEKILFERDVIIWNHKKYIDKPLLTKEDASIARHRRWFNQFYSKNSPKYEQNKFSW